MQLRILLVLVLVDVTRCQLSTTPPPPCTYTNYGTTTPPVHIDGGFTTRIETVAAETNRVINLKMFYSPLRNQVRIQMLDSGKKSDMYFLFETNEILTFDYSNGRGTCSVNKDLANAVDTFIVGGSKNNTVKTPLEVLYLTGNSDFGKIFLKHTPGNTIRDMAVDTYNSCQKHSFGTMTTYVNVTHYFSNKTWSRPAPDIVPVLIEMHGYALIQGNYQHIDHYYNYFDFQSTVLDSDFETPPGIMCLGRNNGLPFPTLPNYIKFSSEHVDPFEGTIGYYEVIYSSDDDLVVLRVQMVSDLGMSGDLDSITVIRDYPSGLSYWIDETLLTCVVQNISDATVLPFDFIDPQGKVQEISPDQLFYKANADFEYIGERSVRGITADTWVTKTNIPLFPDEEVTLEWYFAKPDVSSWNSDAAAGNTGQYRLPVLLRIWHNDNDLLSLDHSIYHVDYSKIMYGTLDIRQCYPQSQSNYFQIVLQGASQLVIDTNIDQFKWSTVGIIAGVANVRPIRIQDLKVYFDSGDAVIEFEVLDAPPFASDAGSIYQITSLQQATQKLNDAVKSGNMTINVWDSAKNTISKPIKVSTNIKISSSQPLGDSGYTAGSMAGLGIAMVIIGGAGGGVGAFFFLR